MRTFQPMNPVNINQKEIVKRAARLRLLNFSRYMQPDMVVEPFHLSYYTILDKFAHGEIKRLIVQMPPQHGKSEGSSRKLPAFMLGLNPDLKIALGTYNATSAKGFNRDVQRIIDTKEYNEVFPETYLNRSNVVTQANNYLRNSDVIEMVGHKGSFRTVGRGGALTGKSVDIVILDDIYKDYEEGNSPIVREAAWNWYTTVVKTRLHNDSQELIVFTRWHEDDLIGKIEKAGEKVVEIKSFNELNSIDKNTWVKINFEAIKTSAPNELDSRNEGEALWDSRHSLEELKSRQALAPMQFQCLYQGNPASAVGRLYLPFKTYVNKEDYGILIRKGAYVDVADEGDDYLFAASYEVRKSDNQIWNENKRRFEPLLFALITDLIMTQEDTDVTTITVPDLFNRNGVQKAWVESNNGGSQFEKTIKKRTKAITEPFYQGANKESRIITDSAMVNAQIIFPLDWDERWPKAYEHITHFLRDFKANEHDDAEDGLTGIYEKELADANDKPYGSQFRGVKVRN